MKVHTSHQHIPCSPVTAARVIKKKIDIAVEPYVHPNRYQNRQLLKKIGLTNPSRALVSNKMLMKVLHETLDVGHPQKFLQRASQIREQIGQSRAVSDEDKLNEVLRQQHIVTDSDYEMILKELKPGDVLAFFTYENPSKVDAVIRAGQRLVKPLVQGSTSDSHNATHIMIVAGVDVEKKQILVAEATPESTHKHEVRTLDFTDKSFRLHAGEFSEYRIYRNDNQELAGRAAEIARHFAKEKAGVGLDTQKAADTSPQYSKKKAIQSILAPANFSSLEAQDAASEADAFLAKTAVRAVKGGRKFFCADFVGFSFLTAEISIKKEQAPKTEPAKSWERELVWQVRASRMTPQKFISSAKKLHFTECLRIIPEC